MCFVVNEFEISKIPEPITTENSTSANVFENVGVAIQTFKQRTKGPGDILKGSFEAF